jgi:hypothetical protein
MMAKDRPSYRYARLGPGRGAVVLRPGPDGVLEAQIFVDSEKEAAAICRHVNGGEKRGLEIKAAMQSGGSIGVDVEIRQSSFSLTRSPSTSRV